MILLTLYIASAFTSIAFAATTLSYVWNIFISQRWLRHHRVSKANEGNRGAGSALPKIAIIIPVYKEQSSIAQSLKFFDNFARKKLVDVYFVTTSREKDDTNETTHEKIQRLLPKYRRVREIISNNKVGFKAAQINYALHNYGLVEKYEWVGIFDVDSCPDDGAIDYLRYHKNDTVQIMQMPTVYRPSASNAKAYAAALFQNKWSLCFEIPSWIRWNNSQKTDMYLVGHGLFVNTHHPITFNDNSVTEDLEIGYKSSRSQIPFMLIPYFDYSLVSDSYISIIKQSVRWYKGEVDNVLLPSRHSTIKRKFEIASWAVGVPTIVCSLAIIAACRSYLLLSIMTLSLLLYVLIIPLIINRNRLSLSLIFWYIVRSAVNPTGPLVCLAKTVLGRNIEFNRTSK